MKERQHLIDCDVAHYHIDRAVRPQEQVVEGHEVSTRHGREIIAQPK